MRRKYQAHGVVHNRRRRRRNSRTDELTQAGRFLSDRRGKERTFIYELSRTHPGKKLEFPGDDVDWEMEYFCEHVITWSKKLLMWVFGWIPFCWGHIIKCLRRKKGMDEDEGKKEPYSLLAPDLESMEMTKPMMWRYQTCIPYVQRRIVKRKWFKNPETRDWAESFVQGFHRHVNRGFRQLCSKIGKDTSIRVGKFVFYGDEDKLRWRSGLFQSWFRLTGSNEFDTNLITPEEMQAVLVYIYTLTWPQDRMSSVEVKRRFFDILELYQIPLALEKRSPWRTQNDSNFIPRTSTDSLLQIDRYLAEEQEDVLFNSAFHPNSEIYNWDTHHDLDCEVGDDFTFDIDKLEYFPDAERKYTPYVCKYNRQEYSLKENSFKEIFRGSTEPRIHPGEVLIDIYDERNIPSTNSWVEASTFAVVEQQSESV